MLPKEKCRRRRGQKVWGLQGSCDNGNKDVRIACDVQVSEHLPPTGTVPIPQLRCETLATILRRESKQIAEEIALDLASTARLRGEWIQEGADRRCHSATAST